MTFLKKQLIVVCTIFICSQTIVAQNDILLSLENAVELALKNNVDISIANNRLNSTRFALKEAKGNFLPKLFLNAGYNRNIDRQVIFLPDGFGLGGNATELGSDNDYRVALNLSIPAYSNNNIATKKLTIAIVNLQNEVKRGIQHTVTNATKKSYFHYLVVQEVVRVQESRLKNALIIVKDIKKRLNQGILTDYDLTSAEVQVANAKNNLLEAQSNLLPAVNSLKLLIGLQPEDTLLLIDKIALQDTEITTSFNIDDFLENNSKLKQLDLDIVRNEQQINLTKSAYYPKLDIIGNYNYQAQANDFKIANYNWVNTSLVGLQLQFSIFNGTVTKNKVQQAKISKEITEIEKEYTNVKYQMEYKELLSQLDFSRQKVVVQENNMNLTTKALTLTKKRYNFGVGTFLEVNDAELAYTQARLNWLQAILNYKSAFYDYQLLIGKK